MGAGDRSRKIIQPGALPKKILITASDPLRSWVPGSLQQQSLQLGQVLQTTLDVYDLIKRFHQELQKFIPYHSLHYFNLQTDHGIEFGTKTECQINYPLSLQGSPLGTLCLTKTTPFEQAEKESIENAINNLIYPLRNAIKYHEAILQSVTDPLTRLGNRNAYDKAISREINFALRHGIQFSLLMVDVDNFKKINDHYGHQTGDEVLRQLGNEIAMLKRNSDIAFRYGGEEFAIILGHTDINGAKYVADRMREQIAFADFYDLNRKIPVTISIGISSFQDGDNAATLFSRADKALYCAKNAGRNQVFALNE